MTEVPWEWEEMFFCACVSFGIKIAEKSTTAAYPHLGQSLNIVDMRTRNFMDAGGYTRLFYELYLIVF